MRNILFSAVAGTARHPIEIIGTILILVTGCYLSLVHLLSPFPTSQQSGTTLFNTTLSPLVPGRRSLLLKQFQLKSFGHLDARVLAKGQELVSKLSNLEIEDFKFGDCGRADASLDCVSLSPLEFVSSESTIGRDLVAAGWSLSLIDGTFDECKRDSLGTIQSCSSVLLSYLIDTTDSEKAQLALKWEERVDQVQVGSMVSSTRPTTDTFNDFLVYLEVGCFSRLTL